MKKIFLLLFVIFTSFIFYQIVLGENGVIEGYKVKKHKERLIYHKSLLEIEKKAQDKQIAYIKNNPRYYEELSENYSFFQKEQRLIKLKNNTTDNSISNSITNNIDTLMNQYDNNNMIDKKVQNMKTMITIVFFLFFSFFIILIILVGENK